MPVPIFTDAKVEAQVAYDSSAGLYTYSYTITNPATNTGKIGIINIDISLPPNTLILRSAGLTIPYGFITQTFDEAIVDFEGDNVLMVPVGILAPLQWRGSLGGNGTAWFLSGDAPNILPGEIQGGFALISRGLPTIRQIELIPEWVFLVESEEDVTPEMQKGADEIEASLPFKTKTLGPTAPPAPQYFDPKAFLEAIRSYVNESVTLGWLLDATLTSTLLSQLDQALSYINVNDPSKSKLVLQEFMTTIEQASSTQRTTEAYGLFFYNAQYLKNTLPDTYIPPVYNLDLTPTSATLPIGAINTLSATYTVDGTPAYCNLPTTGCPVILKVTSGPNMGLFLEERTDENGKATFSYTSKIIGTDDLIAEIPEVPDGAVGATSLPVQVTWTGGPDLVINFFAPPLIKSEGGKPIFITEITANSGSTDASPSITRYFLSEDEIIDPNQDYPIGEREIPSSVPSEESDGGTQEFILPDDITAGTYHLGACADADNLVVELNEDNNCIVNQLQLIVALEPPSNQPPDCTKAVPSIDTLWPPNHKLVTISINGVTDPEADPIAITITRITQDEPVNGLGDGDTSPDGFGVGTSQTQIRAERSGTGNGRVYTISFTATDGKGGTCSGQVKVGVPHDQGKGATPIDDGQNYDSTLP
jgi:hypothetical protein